MFENSFSPYKNSHTANTRRFTTRIENTIKMANNILDSFKMLKVLCHENLKITIDGMEVDSNTAFILIYQFYLDIRESLDNLYFVSMLENKERSFKAYQAYTDSLDKIVEDLKKLNISIYEFQYKMLKHNNSNEEQDSSI